MKFRKKIAFLVVVINVFSACTKFVTIDPPSTQLITSTVFTSDATATSAIIGIYSNMMATSLGFYSGGLTLAEGLSADEFQNYDFSTEQAEFFANSLKPSNSTIKRLWGEPYQYIYTVNAILEGLSKASGISNATISELTGEAKLIRSFSYFYLVNLWGDVPLVLQTSYTQNDTMKRSLQKVVYQQIVQDLLDAQKLLLPDYSAGGGERIRPNKFTATAMLARVYLYNHQWQEAADQATQVLSNTDLYSLESDLNNVFLAGSSEAIWQLQTVTPQINTWEGYYFIMTSGPNSSLAQVALRDDLVSGFEPGDKRKTYWANIDSTGGIVNYYPFKYKIQTSNIWSEYEMVLRLAEQYLIRSEAEANLGDIPTAIADLNIIRERAGLTDLPVSLTFDQCISAIAKERKNELFAEWGHRWLDLKRTGQATPVLAPIKTGWQETDTLYPIPQSEIQNDSKLTQNPGY